MTTPKLAVSRRVRSTPFSSRVEAAGLTSYTVYNHMLLPTSFTSPEDDYWHLINHVQVWDVAAERQVEISGPDAARLVQLMTPRDLSKMIDLQGKYAPICDAQGKILNDPVVIKHADDRWWISLADSDIKLFAKGLAQGYGFDVKVFEPNVFPLAVQGPKAQELMARVFGDQVRTIRFFHGLMLPFQGVDIYVARSGWSKQGGFEIYVPEVGLAEPLWDELFTHGAEFLVAAGCPSGIERLESGLLSYGNDMDEFDTPFECGLDAFINLDAEIESLSMPVLRSLVGKHTRMLVGLAFPERMDFSTIRNYVGGFDVYVDEQYIGEIRSQAWSPRYKKHLAFAMLDKKFVEESTFLEVNGVNSFLHAIPYGDELLSSWLDPIEYSAAEHGL